MSSVGRDGPRMQCPNGHGDWPVNQPGGPRTTCGVCGTEGIAVRRCTDEFAAQLRRMVDDMFAVGHRTVWLDGDDNSGIVFMSFYPPTVEKAKRALQEAGVTCEYKLGHVPAIKVSEGNDDQDS